MWVITVGNSYLYNYLLININEFNESKRYYLKYSFQLLLDLLITFSYAEPNYDLPVCQESA